MSADRPTMRLCEAAEFLGYSPAAFRRLLAEGKVPGPIDPSLRPKLRRWSRPMLERYIDPPVVDTIDPAAETAAPSAVRSLHAVGGVA